jgi:ankyrin repeat protein
MSPLMISAQKGNSHLVKILLDRSAKVNLKDNNNKSALFFAILSKSPESSKIVSMLLEFSANIEQKTKEDVSLS